MQDLNHDEAIRGASPAVLERLDAVTARMGLTVKGCSWGPGAFALSPDRRAEVLTKALEQFEREDFDVVTGDEE